MEIASHVIIPLFIASIIILIMLAMGSGKNSYAIPVDEFEFNQQDNNAKIRVEGFASEIITRQNGERNFQLCVQNSCVPMSAPAEISTFFKQGDELVVTGTIHDKVIHVTQILRRCHGQEL